MSNNKILVLFFSGIFCLSMTSCKKFLDEKSNQSLSTPETLDDLQALADNFTMINTIRMNNNMSDEYYIDYSLWNGGVDKWDQDGYVWLPDLNNFFEWRDIYKLIFHYNTILDHLPKVDSSGQSGKWKAIKGTALFFRAYFHDNIAQLFAPPYDAGSSNTSLAIPLRLTSDFNIESVRSTVQQTYDQILNDLTAALELLPNTLPTTKLYKHRPTKTACYAMLAKVYLVMGNYQKAFEFSNQCINTYNYILDFNSNLVNTSPTVLAPFPTYDNNGEIILYLISNGPLNSYNISYIDSTLYQSYNVNDLRRNVYFRTTLDERGRPAAYYKGVYSGRRSSLFNGIAMDEIYLIRAEASARLGNAQPAMDDLNYLLSRRWKAGFYTPYASLTAEQILPIILTERKKELIHRGTRWSDLRRLNKEPAFAISIQRSLNNQTFTLPPNDKRYTLLIPYEVIIKTNMPQNPR